jgi:uncharacterized protein (UPF0335 family)
LKHEAALETIDKLTADSDALKKRTGYVDEEKKQLIDNIKNKENQLEGVQYENEILQNSINGLKAEVKKLKDNELLLLKYPDLYGPMEQLSNEQELDVYEDMVNQMNANRHRVNLLENLNRKLDHSMKKLKETRPQSNQNMNDSNQYYSNGHNNSNNNNYTQHDEPSFNNTQSGRANEQNFNASFNGTGQGGKNYRHSSTSGENANYFMKPPESSSRRSSISQDKPSSRPYPLYKLDSEMEEENRKQQQGYNSNGNGLVKLLFYFYFFLYLKHLRLALATGQTWSDRFWSYNVFFNIFLDILFRIRIKHQILNKINTLMAFIIFIF